MPQLPARPVPRAPNCHSSLIPGQRMFGFEVLFPAVAFYDLAVANRGAPLRGSDSRFPWPVQNGRNTSSSSALSSVSG